MKDEILKDLEDRLTNLGESFGEYMTQIIEDKSITLGEAKKKVEAEEVDDDEDDDAAEGDEVESEEDEDEEEMEEKAKAKKKAADKE
jgi:hypothetical protein